MESGVVGVFLAAPQIFFHLERSIMLKELNPHSALFREIMAEGYHVYNRGKAQVPGFYPQEFPAYPRVKLSTLGVGDRIGVRVFFRIGLGRELRADGGCLEVEVVVVSEGRLFGRVISPLPSMLVWETGRTVEIGEEEILFKREQAEN